MGVGIDFGSCYSTVAVAEHGAVKPVQLDYDVAAVPSVAFIDETGAVIVGREAELLGAAEPERLIRGLKRDIGVLDSYQVGAHRTALVDVLAAVFQALLERTLAQYPSMAEALSLTLTTPAAFAADGRRNETMLDAAAAAGVERERIRLRSEPEAACLGYLKSPAGKVVRPSDGCVLVYDLGGGTFDAALMRISGDRAEPMAPSVGDNEIGGSLFDALLLEQAEARLAERGETALSPAPGDGASEHEWRVWRCARLAALKQCQELKHKLGAAPRAPLVIGGAWGAPIMFSQQDVDAIIGPRIDATLDLCNALLAEAGVDWSGLNGVILVGGGARMPAVGRCIETRFGRPLWVAPDPARVVAEGAALDADARRSTGAARRQSRSLRGRSSIFGERKE